MKFVADVMLGRLTRLMRFHGYDVEYDPRAKDDQLLLKMRSRILLTKDRSLAARGRKTRVYLIETSGPENQLAEIRKTFPQPDSGRATRCLLCNSQIRRVRKRKVEHLVPPFVYRKHETFYFCSRCRRVYWQGTHFEHLMRMIE